MNPAVETVRVGVIGLGRRWRRRYRPALAALTRHFCVRAVCDQVRRRAEHTARELSAEVAAGPVALMERDDLDALLLLDLQWFGLRPVELAAERRLPVFCCLPDAGAALADPALRQPELERADVMVEMPPRAASATGRARELLEEMGGPRLLLCDSFGSPSSENLRAAQPPLGAMGLLLLDWCAFLVGADPSAVEVARANGAACDAIALEWKSGQRAELRRFEASGVRPGVYLRGIAPSGVVSVELPGIIRWEAGRSEHSEHLRQQPLGRCLLEQFHVAVVAHRALEPRLGCACRAVRLLECGVKSQTEGRRIDLP